MLSIPTIEPSEEVSDGHDDDDGIPTHWTWRFPASVDSLQPVDYRRMVLTYAHLFFIRSLIFLHFPVPCVLEPDCDCDYRQASASASLCFCFL